MDPGTEQVLIDLTRERMRLLKDLAGVLTRAGYRHPQRAKVNAARAKQRKRLRTALRSNERHIISTLIEYVER